jgi:hypothetical protein
VPGDNRCSFDFPMLWIGSTNTLSSLGRRLLGRAIMPSAIAVSVITGRCGPCCSIAATGKMAIVVSGSRPLKSLLFNSSVPTRFAPLLPFNASSCQSLGFSIGSVLGITLRGSSMTRKCVESTSAPTISLSGTRRRAYPTTNNESVTLQCLRATARIGLSSFPLGMKMRASTARQLMSRAVDRQGPFTALDEIMPHEGRR